MKKYILVLLFALISVVSCSKVDDNAAEEISIEEQIKKEEQISKELDSINQSEVDELIDTIVEVN